MAVGYIDLFKVVSQRRAFRSPSSSSWRMNFLFSRLKHCTRGWRAKRHNLVHLLTWQHNYLQGYICMPCVRQTDFRVVTDPYNPVYNDWLGFSSCAQGSTPCSTRAMPVSVQNKIWNFICIRKSFRKWVMICPTATACWSGWSSRTSYLYTECIGALFRKSCWTKFTWCVFAWRHQYRLAGK